MFEKGKQEHVMDGQTVEVRKEVGYEDDMEQKNPYQCIQIFF